ncbi:MAG: hypothetical protein EBT00_17265, partial [Proteobacteria bacterium]|nr:hypothetical protein [Pseudomonadota bacterium]
ANVTGPYKSGDSVTVTATFTETNALYGTPTLSLVANGYSGGTLPAVTLANGGSGLVYTGTFTIPAGNGPVTASVGATDTAGNTLTATGQTGFTIDNTAPTATLTYALDATAFASSLTRPAKSGDTVTVKATFTESIALYGTPTLTLTQDGDATVPHRAVSEHGDDRDRVLPCVDLLVCCPGIAERHHLGKRRNGRHRGEHPVHNGCNGVRCRQHCHRPRHPDDDDDG